MTGIAMTTTVTREKSFSIATKMHSATAIPSAILNRVDSHHLPRSGVLGGGAAGGVSEDRSAAGSGAGTSLTDQPYHAGAVTHVRPAEASSDAAERASVASSNSP